MQLGDFSWEALFISIIITAPPSGTPAPRHCGTHRSVAEQSTEHRAQSTLPIYQISAPRRAAPHRDPIYSGASVVPQQTRRTKKTT